MAKGISETAFASQVEDLLKMFGWHWCHFRPALTGAGWRTAMTGKKGIPDYIAVRPPRLIFAELKDDVKGLTPEQADWINLLSECRFSEKNPIGIEVYLWRPSQFEEIVECLR